MSALAIIALAYGGWCVIAVLWMLREIRACYREPKSDSLPHEFLHGARR